MRYRKLIVPGLFWASVAYNMGVISFTGKNIIEAMNVSKFEYGLLFSITFIGWFIGSFIFGHFSDRFGRRKMVVIATPIHIVATVLLYFSSSYWMFFVLRFFAGLGFGIVLPILSTIVSENSPPAVRGRMVVLLDSFWTYGWVLGSLLAYLMLPGLGSNWKNYYLVALIWLVLIPLSIKLPESKLVVKVKHQTKVKIWEVLRHRHTFWLWIVWFGMAFAYYGVFGWLPSIVSDYYPLIRSYEFVMISYLFQIPGFLTAAYLVEKIGRKKVLFSFIALTGISAFVFITGIAIAEMAMVGMILLSFFDLGAWGALYAITPEIYETKIRGTGAGFANSAGRVGGLLGPLVPSLFASGYEMVFLMYIAVLFAAAFFSLMLPETKGIKFE